MRGELGIWRNQRSFISCLVLGLTVCWIIPTKMQADGCFVWNKEIDINEPTQKAIIVFDDGREDLLLQVKYEGPVENFGWLIPVPGLPKVEKGLIDCFYELSRLTQEKFGVSQGRGAPEKIKVVEIKTVGAYEVAVLSARDAGSLDKWLSAHQYIIPKDKDGIIDDYIRKGWYFVAVKIRLDHLADKKTKAKLASGELHPLLISFDTRKCIFPLRISAVNGGSAEVSLYVLSTEPLLNRFLLDERFQNLEKEKTEWQEKQPGQKKSWEKMQSGMKIYSQRRARSRGENVVEWSLDEMETMSEENRWLEPVLEKGFWFSPNDVLANLSVASKKIPKCAKSIPRLKGKTWYLTKEVRTFSPEEMQDLEFESALLVLARALPTSRGVFAASVLSRCGAAANPILVSACRSTNTLKRIAASSALVDAKDTQFTEPLLELLRDPIPEVRMNAIRALQQNWEPRFVESFIALFGDEILDIRREASGTLASFEQNGDPSRYLKLLADANPHVRTCALGVIGQRISPQGLLKLLHDPDPEVQGAAVHNLRHYKAIDQIPRKDMLKLLTHPEIGVVYELLRHFERGTQPRLSSEEIAPLLKHKTISGRVRSLEMLQSIADKKAVELAFPLLRDPSSIVRSRAFFFFQSIANQNISPDDPAKWEQWWSENKATFVSKQP